MLAGTVLAGTYAASTTFAVSCTGAVMAATVGTGAGSVTETFYGTVMAATCGMGDGVATAQGAGGRPQPGVGRFVRRQPGVGRSSRHQPGTGV